MNSNDYKVFREMMYCLRYGDMTIKKLAKELEVDKQLLYSFRYGTKPNCDIAIRIITYIWEYCRKVIDISMCVLDVRIEDTLLFENTILKLDNDIKEC